MAEVYKDNNIDSFKFKELKVYSSTEYLAGNQKKYRQVFNRNETAYVYAEISLHNKLFDQQDWVISGELRCYDLKKGRKKVCSIPINKKISKYDPVVYIREGWGNKANGVFWKKGTYCWEFWIDNEKVGSKHFYIEDVNFESNENPLLELISVKLYEGAYNDISENERVYLKQFSGDNTRYVYVEMTYRNCHPTHSWQCELFVKFYNEARELKGQVVRLQTIDKNDEVIRISAGWGSNVKGSWRQEKYTAEIVFMDRLLASVPFEVEEKSEEGIAGALLPQYQSPTVLAEEFSVSQTFEELMVQLENLIGLNKIKTKVRDHAKYIQFLQLRREKGFTEEDFVNVHSIFIGNPGTGKTTVAKMMGKLYKKMGVLSKGHVHEVDRVDLVGEYIGQTAPKVKEAIEKARGGVLFIDEAYSLARSSEDNKDFGREVIEILVKEMSNGQGDLVVIAAGYPKEMHNFLNTNPGLKSRFKLYFDFPDYVPQELFEIADYSCREKQVELGTEAKEKVREMIIEAYRNRDRTFGNARFVIDLVEKLKVSLALRVMKNEDPNSLDKDVLSTIEPQDVEHIKIAERKVLPFIPIDEQLLRESLAELNALIGLDEVKKEILELVSLVRFHRESSKDVLNRFFLHTVFVGNPGTGKTTVARILAKIYKALGVLERGHMVETDRQGLVAGFVGQTATKTAEKIEEALGGVLFIDEAYALSRRSPGTSADFGEEAIQTLLKRMEDFRGEFFVFAAGYPDNMESFLKANPGLSSRFDKVLRFSDYEPEQLSQIGTGIFDEKGFHLSKEAHNILFGKLEQLFERRDRYFGNARIVRSIVSEAIKKQNLRLAALSSAQRKKQVENLILPEDIELMEVSNNDLTFSKKKIGFVARS